MCKPCPRTPVNLLSGLYTREGEGWGEGGRATAAQPPTSRLPTLRTKAPSYSAAFGPSPHGTGSNPSFARTSLIVRIPACTNCR